MVSVNKKRVVLMASFFMGVQFGMAQVFSQAFKIPGMSLHSLDGRKKKKNSIKRAFIATKNLRAQEYVGIVDQLVMEFDQKVYCEKEVDDKNFVLKLTFPYMQKDDFEKANIERLCKKIHSVKNIDIVEKESPISGVTMLLTFEPNSVVLKIQKLSDPHVLKIDCYEKSILKKIHDMNDVYMMACNHQIEPPSRCCLQTTIYSC